MKDTGKLPENYQRKTLGWFGSRAWAVLYLLVTLPENEVIQSPEHLHSRYSARHSVLTKPASSASIIKKHCLLAQTPVKWATELSICRQPAGRAPLSLPQWLQNWNSVKIPPKEEGGTSFTSVILDLRLQCVFHLSSVVKRSYEADFIERLSTTDFTKKRL